MENKRRQLMYAIQMYDFYLYELQLYLDTHPTCRNGLFAFRRYKELREDDPYVTRMLNNLPFRKRRDRKNSAVVD